MSNKLVTTEGVLAWAASAGELYFNVGKHHAKNADTAAKIARACRIAEAWDEHIGDLNLQHQELRGAVAFIAAAAEGEGDE